MDKSEIMKSVDYTNLNVNSNFEDIKKLIDEAVNMYCASICIPPCYVADAKKYIEDNGVKMKICTVIGFPNGYNKTSVKAFETITALEDGADEIDMVANIGWEKARDYDAVRNEIAAIKTVCAKFRNPVTLKVIIESANLEEDIIREMCHIVYECGADYIKTSTGFSKCGGASEEAVAAMRDEIDNAKLYVETPFTGNLKIKASGGIRNVADASMYIEKYKVDRIGASSISD